MNKPSTPDEIPSPASADPSYREMLDSIQREIQTHYSHLSARFLPDRCIQAKISIRSVRVSLLNNTPQVLIDILHFEGFSPELTSNYLPEGNGNRGHAARQYLLDNDDHESLGFRFVLKAALGPNFISFWFRNASDDRRLDRPIFYVLAILDRLHAKIREAERLHAFDGDHSDNARNAARN